jgi:hypothetical protein
MDLIVSHFPSVDDDDLPFHVDRFSKNAVGLIVYISSILSQVVDKRGLDMKYPLTWYSNILITVLRATRSVYVLKFHSILPYTYTLST